VTILNIIAICFWQLVDLSLRGSNAFPERTITDECLTAGWSEENGCKTCEIRTPCVRQFHARLPGSICLAIVASQIYENHAKFRENSNLYQFKVIRGHRS